jgi:hypothetical protein
MSVLYPDAILKYFWTRVCAEGFIVDLRVDCQFMTVSVNMVEHFLTVCYGILFIAVIEGSKCFIDWLIIDW